MKTRIHRATSRKPSTKKGHQRTPDTDAQVPPSMAERPPIVTLMGHVDHGKTTLLDTIRSSQIVAKEHGGITQHIGAYRVTYKGKPITFIDTPGHAAFARMRARGAQVTDLVVLVIAANDGVKPQTREALSHIKAAGLPFLVAINKIDLPQANVEKVKGQLAEEGILVTGYGGETVCVEISAKSGKNIDMLMQQILNIAHSQCDLSGNTKGELEAVIIETRHDRRRGPLATLLVKNGALRVGQLLPVAGPSGKVKAMLNENGQAVTEALPGTPVVVLGFKTLPAVGQVVGVKTRKDQLPERIPQAAKRSLTRKEADVEKGEQAPEEEEEKQTIKIVLKADALGTLEAITSNVSEEVEIIGKGVGVVNESDVLLALATGAVVYAFGIGVSTSARKLAELEKISIKTYNIIYELFEDLEKQVLKILEPTIDEEVVGTAQVTQEFLVKGQRIAGCKVKEGEIAKKRAVHLKRGEETIADARIRSLKRGREDVDTVKAGSECGMTFKPDIDFRVGDLVLSYQMIEESEKR